MPVDWSNEIFFRLPQRIIGYGILGTDKISDNDSQVTSGHCRSSKVKNVFPSHFLSKNKMTFFSRLYTKIYTFKEFILKLKSNTSQKDIKLPTSL